MKSVVALMAAIVGSPCVATYTSLEESDTICCLIPQPCDFIYDFCSIARIKHGKGCGERGLSGMSKEDTFCIVKVIHSSAKKRRF